MDAVSPPTGASARPGVARGRFLLGITGAPGAGKSTLAGRRRSHRGRGGADGRLPPRRRRAGAARAAGPQGRAGDLRRLGVRRPAGPAARRPGHVVVAPAFERGLEQPSPARSRSRRGRAGGDRGQLPAAGRPPWQRARRARRGVARRAPRPRPSTGWSPGTWSSASPDAARAWVERVDQPTRARRGGRLDAGPDHRGRLTSSSEEPAVRRRPRGPTPVLEDLVGAVPSSARWNRSAPDRRPPPPGSGLSRSQSRRLLATGSLVGSLRTTLDLICTMCAGIRALADWPLVTSSRCWLRRSEHCWRSGAAERSRSAKPQGSSGCATSVSRRGSSCGWRPRATDACRW